MRARNWEKQLMARDYGPSDDVRRTLRIKKHADGLIPASAERSIRFVLWVAGGIFISASSIITGTIFVISLKSGLSDAKERIAKLEGWQAGTVQTIAGIQTTVGTNKAEIEKRTDSIKHADKMWDQRELGVSNKEVFYIEKGYAPPTINAAQPGPAAPLPRPSPQPLPPD